MDTDSISETAKRTLALIEPNRILAPSEYLYRLLKRDGNARCVERVYSTSSFAKLLEELKINEDTARKLYKSFKESNLLLTGNGNKKQKLICR
jgi:hypothetical protein